MESPNLDSYHSFLQSLIGEEVQVYRGGPESKKGKLLDVQSDYITVYAQNNNNNNNNNNNQNNDENQNSNQNTVVYYRTQHLQSISENTKSNSVPRYQNEEEEEFSFHKGADFSELVGNLRGNYVQINLGGPESKNGMLLEVSDNYVALLTEDDGVVYYNIQHMKSISEYNQNNNENEENSEQEVSIPNYIVTDNFHDIFAEMSHKWVSINRGGPEALEGILVQSAGGHYTLINNDEVLRINPYHIKSISCGPKGVMKNNSNNSEENSSEEVNSSESSSGSQESDDGLTSSSSSSQSSNSRQSSSSRRSSNSRQSSSSRRSSSSKQSSSSRRSSSSSSSRRSRRSRNRRSRQQERVVKTKDYIWVPKG
jgi:spore coat protein B